MTSKVTFARVPARAAGLGMSSTDWSVLHAICLHADRDGLAFPGMARLAAITGLRRKNLPRTILRLENHELLRRERAPRGKGWGATGYRILFAPAAGVLNEDDIPAAYTDDEDVASESVLTRENTQTEVSSWVRTSRVLTGEAILTDGCPQNRPQGVLKTRPHITEGTELTSYHGEEVEGVEDKRAAGVLTGDTAPPCSWYVTNDHGFRLCGRPSIEGERCPEHAGGDA